MLQATALSPPRPDSAGLLLGFIGVLIFSLSLPMTRLAAFELDPGFVAFGRTTLAGLLAIPLLLARRTRFPSRPHLAQLALVSLGVVFGFPLFSTLAMREVDASHGGVVLAILPLATAAAAALLFGERPTTRFWLAASAGALTVLSFALWRSHGALARADLYLVLACLVCAVGYAAGGRLARAMPGLDVIAWALALSLPLSALLVATRLPGLNLAASPTAWLAFLYVTLMSQLVGFIFWYAGLARGGTAKVGQVQLLQVFLTLIVSRLLLHEPVDPPTWLFAILTVAAVWAAQRTRVGTRP